MHLEFQAVNGMWIFKAGEERSGGLISSNPDLQPLQRLGADLIVLRFELKDLRLQDTGTNSAARNSRM
jgi:hypothetical protein